MLEVLERITNGQGSIADIPLLEYLGSVIKSTAFCGLGTSAPNPVLTTLSYFRYEYLKHINEKRCLAGECIALRRYTIISEKCTGCGACRYVCPAHAISGGKEEAAPDRYGYLYQVRPVLRDLQVPGDKATLSDILRMSKIPALKTLKCWALSDTG